jgi:hypothetical protein
MKSVGTTALCEKHRGTSAFGGRYAEHDRTESAVSLRPDLAHAKAEDSLNGAEALSTAKYLARMALMKSKVDFNLADDIAQDALANVINSRNRGTVDYLTRGLVASATRQAVAQHLNIVNGSARGVQGPDEARR